ncbi:hypothetical protein [Vibrio intestinalis]|uniref:hypothetical protein n=1 Tax=Vibrio intestinalis TaxID=2933291 RepID=UPI0021A77A1B|nr:hypothetical protein [Vibrio intestinalis]
MPNSNVEVSDQDIEKLDNLLKNIDSEMAVSMSYARRAQGITFDQLEKRVTGINASTLKRYMQQSYPSMRPIHVVAAMSWVMMVPMTSFYYGLKLKEHYRGMDDKAIEALLCIGRLPSDQFDVFLQLVCNLMDAESRAEFEQYRLNVESQVGSLDHYNELLPPPVLDVNAFAIDYYRSISITAKRFREENNISIETLSRVLGISTYQYSILEDINKIRDFPVAIGFRVKLGFHLDSHADFSSEMRQFPQFHRLRQMQHVRDSLIVESLRKLDYSRKNSAIQILTTLSKIYI